MLRAFERLSDDDQQAMPIKYLRKLTGSARTDRSNAQLVRFLAFVAGAVNAGGFLAVHQYTSHVSGFVSAMADNLAVGSLPLVMAGSAALLSFVVGSASTAFLARWARRHHLESQLALPLFIEACMLMVFGATGYVFEGRRVLGTVMLLCFTMGLQNAIVTNVSGAVVRATHLTGMVTDLGIKVGRMLYSFAVHEKAMSSVQTVKLTLLSSLVCLFFLGGVTGAVGYKQAGFLFTIPLAVLLMTLAAVPLFDDLRARCVAVHRS